MRPEPLCLCLVVALSGGGLAQPPAKPRTLHLPDPPHNYANVDLPPHFRTEAVRDLDNTPSDNPITDAGATLGRVLFYDTRLSANGSTACASCHEQKHAFSDPKKFSKGFEGKFTDRNAMPLSEARFYPRGRYFWDERAATLEEQVLLPIQNKVEMGRTLPKLIDQLAAAPEYPPLFKAAFGDPRVSSNRASRALAQFVRSMVSYQSKYDEGLAQVRGRTQDFPNFTREENRGKALFFRACAICHVPGQQDAVFLSPQAQNNGLDANAALADLGRADVTLRPADVGRFKSPSLRNVEYTGPYMHDGRFAKLEDVVEHYSTGLKRPPNLDGRLLGPAAGGGFRFTTGEKAALVAFLKTLSDPKFLTDPKFSDPFKN